MATSESIVRLMVDNGESDEDIKAFISQANKKKEIQAAPSPAQAQALSLENPVPSGAPVDDSIPEARDILGAPEGEADFSGLPKAASPYVRTGLMGGLGTAGAAFGLTSPVPGGALIGGTLATAAGDQLADRYDEAVGLKKKPEDFGAVAGEAVGDLKEAAMWNMGVPAAMQAAGTIAKPVVKHAIAPVAKRVKNAWSGLGGESEKIVGTRLARVMLGDDLTSLSRKETEELLKEMPDLRLTLGKAGNDTGLLMDAESSIRANSADTTRMLAENAAHNKKVMEAYFRKHFPKGDGDIFGVLEAINRVKQTMEGGVNAAKSDLDEIAALVSKAGDSSVVGQTGQDVLETAKANAKKIIDAEWETMPVGHVENAPIVDRVEKFITKLKDAGKELDEIPKSLPEAIGRGTAENQATLTEFREWAQSAGETARNNQVKNPGLAKNSRDLKEILQEPINDAITGSEYKNIRTRYAHYKKTFHEGEVGKVLDKYKQFDASKIPSLFFKNGSPETVGRLKQAVGDEKATQMLDEFALNDVYGKAINSETGELVPKTFSKWLKKNEFSLKEAGLFEKYSDFDNVAKSIKLAENVNKEFQKKAAHSMLGVDPQHAIAQLFSKESTQEGVAKETIKLLRSLKGNPTALKGFRAAFADFIVMDAKGVKLDIESMLPMMKKYDAVINTLYSGAQKKAMYTMRTALQKMQATAPPHPAEQGGGMATNLIDGIAPFIFKKYSAIAGFKNIVKAVVKGENMREGDIMLKAVFDPKFADDLIKAAEKQGVEEFLSSSSPLSMPQNQSPYGLLGR